MIPTLPSKAPTTALIKASTIAPITAYLIAYPIASQPLSILPAPTTAPALHPTMALALYPITALALHPTTAYLIALHLITAYSIAL